MLLSDYRPRPALVTRSTSVLKPRFPVIGAHNHLAELFDGGWDKHACSELLEMLDAAEVRVYVDFDGGWGEDILHRHLGNEKAAPSVDMSSLTCDRIRSPAVTAALAVPKAFRSAARLLFRLREI